MQLYKDCLAFETETLHQQLLWEEEEEGEGTLLCRF
jgi:hypothetical protein